MTPGVSVVIPTYRRPERVIDAVRSVLSQRVEASGVSLEIVVVIDGLDNATVRAVAAVGDRRVRAIVPEANLGNAAARNLGVRESRGDWVAFLDDDDLFLPGKLAAQLAAGRAAVSRGVRRPLVTCRMLARTERGDHVWPRRRMREGEAVADYLFRRSSPLSGEGMLQTSTWLMPRDLAAELPFDSSVKRYVDLDWVLRAATLEGFAVVFPDTDTPLSVWAMEENRPRVSNVDDAGYALDWARQRRHLMTGEAYAGFLLWIASVNAAKTGRREYFRILAREARANGRPRTVDWVTHALNFAVPREALRRAAGVAGALVTRRKAGVPT